MQVKGFIPPEDRINRKTPTGKAAGEMWYGITFPVVQKFVILWDNFIGIAMEQKNGDAPQPLVAMEHLPLCVFV